MIVVLWTTRPYTFAADTGLVVAPAGVLLYRWDVPDHYEVPEGLEIREEDGSPFWTPPPAPRFVPESITNFQVRAVLLSMPSPTGIAGRTLFQDIDDTLRAESGLAWAAWEYANDVTRGGALVNSLGARLGMTPDDLDQIFVAGAGISA